MNGTQWVYELVDKITSPLTNIYKELELTDHAAQRTETSIHEIGGSSGAIDVTANAFDNLGDSIVGSAAGFGLYDVAKTVISEVADTIRETVGEIVQTRGEYQKFQAILDNSFQSAEKGAAIFSMLEEFAATTPFELDRVTGSFIKMNAQGFTPTLTQLTKLGDFASAMGKDFDQLAEAVMDAQTGEFERLKEFGVKTDAHGDKIKFTFKGVTTEIDKNASSIQNYLLGLGDMQGVQGSMAAMMDTIPFKMSAIEDARAKLYNRIGELFEPGIDSWLEFKSNAIEGMTNFVEWIQQNGDEIQDTMESIAVSVGVASGAWFLLNAEMLIGQGVAGGALLLIKSLEVAQWAWNLALSANPIGIVIGLVAALAGAIYYAWNQSETFRATIYGLWESVQVVFSGIYDLVKGYVTGLFDLFYGLGEIMVGVFTIDVGLIKKGMDDAWTALADSHPIDKIQKIGEDAGKAYRDGYNGSLAMDAAEAADEKKNGKKPSVFDSVVTAANATGAGAKGGKSTSSDSSSLSGAGGSGGGGVRNVTTHIANLLRIDAKGMSADEVEKLVEKKLPQLLIASVRDFEVGIS